MGGATGGAAAGPTFIGHGLTAGETGRSLSHEGPMLLVSWPMDAG